MHYIEDHLMVRYQLRKPGWGKQIKTFYEGEFHNELEDGARTVMTKGATYVVSDGASSHRSRTEKGATLLIIDGDFLKGDR